VSPLSFFPPPPPPPFFLGGEAGALSSPFVEPIGDSRLPFFFFLSLTSRLRRTSVRAFVFDRCGRFNDWGGGFSPFPPPFFSWPVAGTEGLHETPLFLPFFSLLSILFPAFAFQAECWSKPRVAAFGSLFPSFFFFPFLLWCPGFWSDAIKEDEAGRVFLPLFPLPFPHCTGRGVMGRIPLRLFPLPRRGV